MVHYDFKMSERLIKLVNDALIKKGMRALLDKTGLSETAVYNIASGIRVPRRHNAYKLALACGVSEEDALAIAYECHPQEAKRTA